MYKLEKSYGIHNIYDIQVSKFELETIIMVLF